MVLVAGGYGRKECYLAFFHVHDFNVAVDKRAVLRGDKLRVSAEAGLYHVFKKFRNIAFRAVDGALRLYKAVFGKDNGGRRFVDGVEIDNFGTSGKVVGQLNVQHRGEVLRKCAVDTRYSLG